LKEEGNALFKKGENLKAAGIYAKATKVDPTSHVLFRFGPPHDPAAPS